MINLSKFRETNVKRCEEVFGHKLNSWSVAEWAAACLGELGEAANIAKKMLRFRDNVKGNKEGMTRDDYKAELALEMADAFIYLDLWAASEGIDLEDAIQQAFNNKSRQLGSDLTV